MAKIGLGSLRFQKKRRGPLQKKSLLSESAQWTLLGSSAGIVGLGALSNIFTSVQLSPTVGGAFVLSGLLLLTARNMAMTSTIEGLKHEVEQLSDKLGSVVKVVQRRREEMTPRPNSVATWSQCKGEIRSLHGNVSVEARIAKDGAVEVDRHAVLSAASNRMQALDFADWRLAFTMPTPEEMLFSEKKWLAQRIVATLLAMKEMARSPGYTTAGISIYLVPRQRDANITMISAYHAEFETNVVIGYFADHDGDQPGSNATPSEVVIDSRSQSVTRFNKRWANTVKGCEPMTLDAFLEAHIGMLDCGVRMRRPDETSSVISSSSTEFQVEQAPFQWLVMPAGQIGHEPLNASPSNQKAARGRSSRQRS
jgi:hypothetical protein